MRPFRPAALRQVARGLVAPTRRTFAFSARRLNSEETSADHNTSMSQLMQQATRLESAEANHRLSSEETPTLVDTFVHNSSPSKTDTTEIHVLSPARVQLELFQMSLHSPHWGSSQFPFYYLRDCCRCPRCVDPHSKQRSFLTKDIPTNIFPRRVKWDGTLLEIKWGNDIPGYGEEHESSYDIRDLINGPTNTHENNTKATRPYHWGKEMMTEVQHWVSFDDYMSDEKRFALAMRNLQRTGLIFVKDIPKSRELVKKIAERMGPLRNSFYGETWDVRTVPQAKNVAYTNQHLGFHMDLLYMNEPPGYQLLHCLENSCEGGESLFADTFRVAEIMRKKWPAEYKILTRQLFGFEYVHKDHIYSNTRPLFETDKRTGILRNVNYSPPFQAPIPQSSTPGGVENHEYFVKWRHALSTFTRILQHQASVFQLKLEPGECVIFANRRIVHARNQFSTASGSRWLAGAYVDEDALLSTFATTAQMHENQWKHGDPWISGRNYLSRRQSERAEDS